MMNLEDRKEALDKAIRQMEKQYGLGALMRLGDQVHQRVEVISTGSPSLDLAVGVGGYPRGRVVEIFGPESSGKTTLTLHAIASCQAAGGVAAFIDAEHALDATYAAKLGVRVDDLLVSQPDHGEQALDIVEALVSSGAVDLVVVDSVAALVPKAELEGDMGDSRMCVQHRLMSKALRKLTGVAHRNNACVVFINQLRQKIGVTFGPTETTTGGNALKFYATLRLDVRKIGSLKKDNEDIGTRTKVKVVKNKLAPPFRVVEMDIIFGKGISHSGDLLDLAEARGLVTKNGTWLSFGEERLGQGRERAREVLDGNPAMAERMLSLIRASDAGDRGIATA